MEHLIVQEALASNSGVDLWSSEVRTDVYLFGKLNDC